MISKSLPGCFGIELSKIDLSSSLSNDEIANIKKLFQDFHLIVFKEQNLNDDDQLKFTEYFGELEEFPEADKTKESNKTYHVANVTVEGKHLTEEDDQVIFQKVNQRWHTDSSYRFIPSSSLMISLI